MTNSLNKAQFEFSRALGLLLTYAYQLGYTVTMGDTWAKDGHKENSKHYIRLAADLNLFKDGKYLTDTESHRLLGMFWNTIGGIWGGRFKDGNHYEWPYNEK